MAELLHRARGRPERLGSEGVRALGAYYRAAAAELARARRRAPQDPTTARLETLVAGAHSLVYANSARRHSLVHFASRQYWQLVLEEPSCLALSAALLLVPMALTFLWGLADPAAAAGLVPGLYQGVTQPRPHGAHLQLPTSTSAALASGIFTNNIGVAFLAFAGGLTAGVLTAVALVTNGAMLGVVAGLALQTGHGPTVVQLIAPHGVLELSCIVVAGSAGLRLAQALVDPGLAARGEALGAAAPHAVQLVLGTAAWLVVAGLVEGFVTPQGLGVPEALGLGLGLGGIFWALVVTRGREQGSLTLEPAV